MNIMRSWILARLKECVLEWHTPCVARLKENMRSICYDDLDELEFAVAEQVRVYVRGCLGTGIADLPKR